VASAVTVLPFTGSARERLLSSRVRHLLTWTVLSRPRYRSVRHATFRDAAGEYGSSFVSTDVHEDLDLPDGPREV